MHLDVPNWGCTLTQLSGLCRTFEADCPLSASHMLPVCFPGGLPSLCELVPGRFLLSKVCLLATLVQGPAPIIFGLFV